MKKFIYVLVAAITICCAFISLSLANLRYNPDQIDQFKTTGVCIGCDLTSASIDVNYDVVTPFNLNKSNISNSTMWMGNNTLSDFSEVIAIKTSFFGNNYSQANFQNAVLIDANFSYSQLMYANFTNANVSGADFSDANLYGSQGIDFSQASSVCDAIMPDGSKGACK